MAENKGRKVYVETPKGKIVEVRHRDGTVSMELEWNPGFAPGRNKQFCNVQSYVDSECIRLMSSYTPKQNGILIKSATLGTQIGSGNIEQVAPYARYQYYGTLMVSSVTGSAWSRHGESKVLTDKPLNYHGKNPKGGKMWFERMKADHKDAILRGAARISGGKAK